MEILGEPVNWSPLLDALADIVAERGGKGWLVGGCLRDALLGLAAADVDIVATGDPLPVAEQLAQRLPLAIARLGHGTVRLVPREEPGTCIDLSPLAGSNIDTDLTHRDFTVNAMALPLAARVQWIAMIHGQGTALPDLHDPFGGRDDLLARRLVATGPDAFRYDPGRIIRAARLRARFGLWPDAETLQLAREEVPRLVALSADRLREEMELLLALPDATDGVVLLETMGALAVLFPQLTGALASHALATLRQLDKLMDTTQPSASYPALGSWGASTTRRVALRLAALHHASEPHDAPSNAAESDQATLWRIARAALDTGSNQARLTAVRLLFDRAGRTAERAAADALIVAAACALASDDQTQGSTLAARANAVIDLYLHDRSALIPPFLLTGGELIRALGVSAGPGVGRLLHEVRLAQLAGEITGRDEALALARRLHESSE